MSLISWKTPVDVKYLDPDDEQAALVLMLTRDSASIAQWEGMTVIKHKQQVVQVRKDIRGTRILINIGHKPEMDHCICPLHKESDVCISANGKMNYTIDEITELNLVVKEAYGVYTNIMNVDKE